MDESVVRWKLVFECAVPEFVPLEAGEMMSSSPLADSYLSRKCSLLDCLRPNNKTGNK